jgi:tyrosyl-tRNA synthetase
MKNVIDCLQERGFIDSMTSEDLKNAANLPLKIYCGFDPTADSLHLGNLVPVMGLAWFQKFGHTPYALVGGATGRIGDPSGKSNERNLLDDVTLSKNIRALKKSFEKLLSFKEGPKPVILDNNDWLGSFSLLTFLRDVGKHFRVGSMMAKESVRARLQSEEGLSFTEFSYQILQAYDFHYLNDRYGITVQLGATDQWGNITAGTEFNRKLGGPQLFGLTFPLLTRSDGKKFGKSEEGAIWLSPEKLSPYQFYQHLFRMADADVIRLLKMLTFLPMKDIQEIERSMQEPNYAPNSAQKRLAEEVTRFVHGQAGLESAQKVTEGMAPGADATLNAEVLMELAKDMPSASLPQNEVLGHKFTDVAVKIQFLASKSEAARLIKNGGAYLNNERITDPMMTISATDLIDGRFLLFSAGKKNRMILSIDLQA